VKAAKASGPDVAALEQFLSSIGVDADRDPEYGVTAALLAELLFERTAPEAEPALIDEDALGAGVRHPHHDRRVLQKGREAVEKRRAIRRG